MNLDGTKRGRAGAKRFDIRELKAAIRDGRTWNGTAVVYLPDGETAHYEFETDDSGNVVDVLVCVLKMPAEEPLLARLNALSGLWRIPPVGAEVALMYQQGGIQGQPIIVGVLASSDIPAELDEDTVVLKDPKVKVLATTGDVEIDATAAGKQVKLGGGSAAVVVDDGKPTGLDAWITAVNTAFNGLGVTVTAPTSHHSAKVKA